jgi:hypothetical protein
VARVVFDSEARGTATLIEIVAEDRPGLLYDLAAAISANGGNIEVVLIDTQAHKAIDVFYVTAGGGKLTAEKQAAIRVAVEKAAGVAGRFQAPGKPFRQQNVFLLHSINHLAPLSPKSLVPPCYFQVG